MLNTLSNDLMKKEGYLPYKKLKNLLFPETYLKISSLQSDWETPKSLLVVLEKYVHDPLKVFSYSKTIILHVNLQQLRTQFKSKIFLENLVKPCIVILKNPLQTYVWPFFLKILSNLGVVLLKSILQTHLWWLLRDLSRFWFAKYFQTHYRITTELLTKIFILPNWNCNPDFLLNCTKANI